MPTTQLPTKQIGLVEVLTLRIYTRPDGSEVAVEPGTYPILQKADQTIYWTMTGHLNDRNRTRPIQGMEGAFFLYPGDHITDVEATVDSKPFTPDEFWDFMSSDPLIVDGPDQRLRIEMF